MKKIMILLGFFSITLISKGQEVKVFTPPPLPPTPLVTPTVNTSTTSLTPTVVTTPTLSAATPIQPVRSAPPIYVVHPPKPDTTKHHNIHAHLHRDNQQDSTKNQR